MCSNAGRGGVEDTTFEAKAKDFKKIRGQGPTFEDRTFQGLQGQGHVFSNLLSPNFAQFLNAKAYRILHFVKFLMIIQK